MRLHRFQSSAASNPAVRLASYPASHWPPLPSGELDVAVERKGTHSRKLGGPGGAWIGRQPPVIPLRLADMDFRCAQPIVDSIVDRAQHGLFGYTDSPPELDALLLGRLRSVYGCPSEPSRAWLRWIPGLIGGLNDAVRAVCSRPTDAVAVVTPSYAPFLGAPLNAGARLVRVPLVESRRGVDGLELHYAVDWRLLEQVCADPATKLVLWCNPHNPVGRCWTRRELARLARLCARHDVVICSDEVWGELPLDPTAHPFTSMLSLLPASAAVAAEADGLAASVGLTGSVGLAARRTGLEADGAAAHGDTAHGDTTSDPDALAGVPGLSERLIVLTSPMKAFNIASLCVGVGIVPDHKLWQLFDRACAGCADISCFGFATALTAYGDAECEAWRQRVVAYVRANRAYAYAALTSMGRVRCVLPEATYLMWFDATEALPPGTDALRFFLASGVGLSGGVPFGAAPGMCRINLACRRETLEEGLVKMAAALDEVWSEWNEEGGGAETGARRQSPRGCRDVSVDVTNKAVQLKRERER